MPSNPKNTVSTVIPGPRVRILLPPGESQMRTSLRLCEKSPLSPRRGRVREEKAWSCPSPTISTSSASRRSYQACE
jgi:hypothetical protein